MGFGEGVVWGVWVFFGTCLLLQIQNKKKKSLLQKNSMEFVLSSPFKGTVVLFEGCEELAACALHWAYEQR